MSKDLQPCKDKPDSWYHENVYIEYDPKKADKDTGFFQAIEYRFKIKVPDFFTIFFQADVYSNTEIWATVDFTDISRIKIGKQEFPFPLSQFRVENLSSDENFEHTFILRVKKIDPDGADPILQNVRFLICPQLQGHLLMATPKEFLELSPVSPETPRIAIMAPPSSPDYPDSSD